MKVLSKSRFKLGLECPNKLFYTGKKEYANTKQEDTFMQSLAEGGFQVEELARMHYPGGVLLEGKDWDYQWLHNQTQELLKRDQVIIYEAAFLVDGLFIRTDVLIKNGQDIKIVEVKAKSYDAHDPNFFVGVRGKIKADWKPYLFDLAFQVHVAQKALSECSVKGALMLADKSKKASIDGLNQLFRIAKNSENRTGIIKKVNSLQECGNSVLTEIDVQSILNQIFDNSFKYHENLSFLESIQLLRDQYHKDEFTNWPLNYGTCKTCEFHTDNTNLDHKLLKSGKAECFKKQKGFLKEDLDEPNLFDVWNFPGAKKLFEAGDFFMRDLNMDQIITKTEANRLTNSERQWIQIEKAQKQDWSIYVEKEGLKAEMDNWKYPLHFIDFETSAVALPFTTGMHPYEQVAFQFSHHMLHEDGRIEHKTEFLNSQPGVFPNFEFVRVLKAALENDEGSIFKYSKHENSILNAIALQLQSSKECDKEELINFIRHITHSKKESAEKWCGERDMIDLLEVIKLYYYNPLMKGSNSLKAVLPAILNSNKAIQEKYSRSIGELNITSKNFSPNHVWIKKEDGKVLSPYKQLPPLFEGVETVETLSDMESLADGGAALTAYAKLQYEDMSSVEREAICEGLLRYCELDTLAMVLVWEELRNIIS